MSPKLPLSLAAAIVATCGFLRGWLESDPVTHVLVQLPLLALAGAMGIAALTNRPDWPPLPLILVAIFTTAFWMLPRSIDAALVTPSVELAKFVTVPCLIGAPLLIGWRQAHPLLRGFLKAQTISMLAVMAFLYTHAPIRICNAYLVADQERLGFGFLLAAAVCAILWTVPIFMDQKRYQLAEKQAATS
ncbi:MAG: hypothetical protein ACRBM6_12105 [Geminicoccales bacterium]